MPNLKSLRVGYSTFVDCSRIVLESESARMRMTNRLAGIDLHSSGESFMLFQEE